MGFITSYILLAILGYLAHYFGQKRKKYNNIFVAWYGTIICIIFLAVDIAFYTGLADPLIPYLNSLPWLRPDFITDGKDLMWNSFKLLGINMGITYSKPLDYIAVLLFLGYVPWFVFFKGIGHSMYGARPHEEGIWWILQPLKKPKKK